MRLVAKMGRLAAESEEPAQVERGELQRRGAGLCYLHSLDDMTGPEKPSAGLEHRSSRRQRARGRGGNCRLDQIGP